MQNWKKLVAAAAAMVAAGAVYAQKTELTVYTALEIDQLKAYETAFNKSNPDIAIKWVGNPPAIPAR